MTDPTPTPGDDLAAVLAQAWHPATVVRAGVGWDRLTRQAAQALERLRSAGWQLTRTPESGRTPTAAELVDGYALRAAENYVDGMLSPAVSEPELEDELLAVAGPPPEWAAKLRDSGYEVNAAGPPPLDSVPWIVMPASGGPLIVSSQLLHGPGLAVYPAPGPEGATRDVSDQSGEFRAAPATLAIIADGLDVPLAVVGATEADLNHDLVADLRRLFDRYGARGVIEAADVLAPEARRDPEADDRRKPSLGGRVQGTGHWTVDAIDRPENPLGSEGVTSRPALRDPEGGAWASWLNLPQLDRLRDQLEAGARALDAGKSPRSIDGALAAHLNILALTLAMGDNPGPIVAASTQVEGKKFDVIIAAAPQPDPPVDDDSDDPAAIEAEAIASGLWPPRPAPPGYEWTTADGKPCLRSLCVQPESEDHGPEAHADGGTICVCGRAHPAGATACPCGRINTDSLPAAEPVAEVTVDVETDDGEVLGHVQVPVTIDRLMVGGHLVDVGPIRDAARSWLGGPDPAPASVAEVRRGRHGRPHAVAHLFLAFGPGRLGRRFGEWLHFHTTEFIEETPDA